MIITSATNNILAMLLGVFKMPEKYIKIRNEGKNKLKNLIKPSATIVPTKYPYLEDGSKE